MAFFDEKRAFSGNLHDNYRPRYLLIRASTAYIPHEHAEDSPLAFHTDSFYHNPMITKIVAIKNCIVKRYDMNIQNIRKVMEGKSYKQISAELFISSGTLRYRLNKIFSDIGVKRHRQNQSFSHVCLALYQTMKSMIQPTSKDVLFFSELTKKRPS